MKVYRIPAGTYFEKQEDARKADRKFEAVDFAFAASPKADFVDWLNSAERQGVQASGSAATYAKAEEMMDCYQFGSVSAQPQPTQPSPAHAAQVIAFEDQFGAMPLALQLHYAALAVENARKVDVLGTAPGKAPQRYGSAG